MSVERRFHLAGLEVALVGSAADSFDDMAGYYDRYPASGVAPQLIVEIERRPRFAEDRERGPEYPAFRVSRTEGGERYERFDAVGTVVPGSPRRARFVVGGSPNSLEAAIRIAVAAALPEVGATIFHASGIEAGGEARLFLGKSGAGKSTIAALLHDAGAGRKISDELVVVSVAGGRPEAVVAPFIGAAGLPHGERYPLASLDLLVQAPRHHRRRLGAAEALGPLLRHLVSFARAPAANARVLDIGAELVARVPCFELSFAPRADVAAVLGLPYAG